MADPRPDYLARLDAALVGPGRIRRGLVREAADHLDDATEALVAAGHDEESAAHRAVVDFGPVADIAASFQTTLAVAASRRTAWLLLLVLGYQPLLWDSGLNLASNTAEAPSGTWLFHLLDDAIEAGSWVVLAGALLLLMATGIGSRWWFDGRATARFTGAFALAATTFVPLTSVAMIVTADGTDAGLWMLALTLVVLPLVGVAVSARRTLAAS